MEKEVSNYFFRKYEKASFRVPFGHWPDFQSKEEVDEWIGHMESSTQKLAEHAFANKK